jgi:hypothetical protein
MAATAKRAGNFAFSVTSVDSLLKAAVVVKSVLQDGMGQEPEFVKNVQ